MIEKEHILDVLKQAKKAVKEEDIIKLRDLSNQTIHSASINQDTDSILIAVVIYSLSKILERTNYREYPGWKNFLGSSLNHISRAISGLEKNDANKFLFELKKIRQNISSLAGNFKNHVKDVFEKAEISKASRIYEHGISLEKTAKLLGITMWQLAEYAGETGISDVNLSITMPVKARIKLAEEMFAK